MMKKCSCQTCGTTSKAEFCACGEVDCAWGTSEPKVLTLSRFHRHLSNMLEDHPERADWPVIIGQARARETSGGMTILVSRSMQTLTLVFLPVDET